MEQLSGADGCTGAVRLQIVGRAVVVRVDAGAADVHLDAGRRLDAGRSVGRVDRVAVLAQHGAVLAAEIAYSGRSSRAVAFSDT
jgi:hypothetical protein